MESRLALWLSREFYQKIKTIRGNKFTFCRDPLTGKVKTEYSLTAVNDKSREEMINTVVGLSALGGTCLHLGLEEGMRALESGGVKEGGVIIFLTDGQQECAVRQPPIGL